MKRIYSNWVSSVLILLFSLLCTMAYSQVKVTGTIRSSEGEALPGVNVVIKGTTTGTITDLSGQYSISVSGTDDVLVFSSIGYLDKEVVVGDQTIIEVSLDEDITSLDDVIVIGYGTQKKKEVTGAVAHVTSDEIAINATSDIGTALQGMVAGVNVQASTGAPGAKANIQIRGISSTIEGANNNPLFVIDGIPQVGDPNISIEEIETIDILKDLASASIYGVRSAGGVILITTKKGSAGKMKVSLGSYAGIQNITSGIPLQNLEEHLYTRMLENRNVNYSTDQQIWTPLQANRANFGNNTNLMDVIQNDNALIQDHHLTVSGGSDNLTYNVVGGFHQAEGAIINSGYERFNVRANTILTRNKLRVQTNVSMSIDEREREPWLLLYEAYKYKPFLTDLDPNVDLVPAAGGDDTSELRTAGNMMQKLKQTDIENGENFNGSLRFDYEIIKGLTFNSQIGAMFYNTTRVLTKPRFYLENLEGEPVVPQTRSEMKYTSGRKTNLVWESGINYKRSFGDHNIALLGVYSMEKETYGEFFGQRYDIVNNEITVLNGAIADPNAESGNPDDPWKQAYVATSIGILSRAQYNYKERYLFSASIRRDGSSKFSPDNKWGYFPSVSLGWNMADESFWTPVAHIINSAKPRFSYGTAGNDRILNYGFDPTISLSHDYTFGPAETEQLNYGYTQVKFANTNLQWETSKQKNLGIDLAFFDNRLTFNADIYKTDKEDMLFPITVPPSVGVGDGTNATVVLNIGNMTNKGIGLSMGYRQAGTFTWGVNSTFSRNVNEVTKISGENTTYYFDKGKVVEGAGVQNPDRVTVLREGYEAGAFFVMPTNGIVNTEEKLAEYLLLKADAKMGDLIYIDQNNDGILDEKDRVYGGSGAPEFETSLGFDCSYRNFDFSMQWYASVGNEIINGSKVFAYMNNSHRDVVYQWSAANPYAVVPVNRGSNHENYRGYADVWVEDGSFVRLRNVQLGYNLPKSLLEKIKVDKLRIYIAATNPVTLTKYEGYDPEVGNDGLAQRGLDRGNYPVSRMFRGGIQLDF